MKAKRKIIKIDEAKCNGCGVCIPDCPEGALRVIDGKARLVGDLLCDGLGACVGNCPRGAITVEEREAEPYDEKKVIKNIVPYGADVIKAHLKHLKEHCQDEYFAQAIAYLKINRIDVPDLAHEPVEHHAGCPGTRTMDLRKGPAGKAAKPAVPASSELRQWPIQLALLNPSAPYFKDADLLIAADCTPFAFPEFHRRFLRNKILVMFCPKLDQSLDAYVDKLARIFRENRIKSVAIVHMEVPCCFGVESIVTAAMQRAGRNIVMKDYTISIQGEII